MWKNSARRGGIGIAVAAMALTMGASQVAADDYPVDTTTTTTTTEVPGPDPAITPVSSTQPAGATFQETVTGCVPPETVTFTFEGQTVAITCSDGGLAEAVSGTAVASLVAPAQAGTYMGNAFLETSNVNLPFTVIVEAETVAPSLPPTGSDSNQIVPIAFGLVVAGGALFGIAAIRRRRVPA